MEILESINIELSFRNTKKKEKHKKPLQIQQKIEVLLDVAPGITPLQQEQSIEVIPDGAPPGTTRPHQEQNIEVMLHGTPGVTPLQQGQDTEVIQETIAAAILPYDAKWVAERFLTFLTK